MNFFHRRGEHRSRGWQRIGIFLITGMIFWGNGSTVLAAENETDAVSQSASVDESELLQGIIEELDLNDVDAYIKEELPEKMSFQSLVAGIVSGGENSGEIILEYLEDLFFYEIRTAKPIFFQILCVSLLFAVFSRIFVTRQGYVSHLGFLAVYVALMMLLLDSFLLVNQVVEDGIDKILSFMTAFVPTYAATLLLAGNGSSAGMFYELAFALIYLIELAMKNILIPGVHIFVLLQLLDHLFEETKLSRLADLIESTIKAVLKLAIAAVVGLSVVQSLLAPARDRLSSSSVFQTLQAIPGVGNTFGATGEILIGCGIMIKNSVGTAALVVLTVLCASPAFSVACFHVMYRLAGALLQPFGDKRIGESVHGVSRGCSLYLKIIVDTMLLFFIAVSMISASTSFIY